jgi:hypothetical protein
VGEPAVFLAPRRLACERGEIVTPEEGRCAYPPKGMSAAAWNAAARATDAEVTERIMHQTTEMLDLSRRARDAIDLYKDRMSTAEAKAVLAGMRDLQVAVTAYVHTLHACRRDATFASRHDVLPCLDRQMLLRASTVRAAHVVECHARLDALLAPVQTMLRAVKHAAWQAMALAGKIALRVIQTLWRYRAYLSFAYKVYSLYSGAAVVTFVIGQLLSSTLVSSALVLLKGVVAYACTVFVKQKLSLLSTFLCGLIWSKRDAFMVYAERLQKSSGVLASGVGKDMLAVIREAQEQVRGRADTQQLAGNLVDVAVAHMLNRFSLFGWNFDSLVAAMCNQLSNFAVDVVIEPVNMAMNLTRGTLETQTAIATNETNRLQMASFIGYMSQLVGMGSAAASGARKKLQGPKGDEARRMDAYLAKHGAYEHRLGQAAAAGANVGGVGAAALAVGSKVAWAASVGGAPSTSLEELGATAAAAGQGAKAGRLAAEASVDFVSDAYEHPVEAAKDVAKMVVANSVKAALYGAQGGNYVMARLTDAVAYAGADVGTVQDHFKDQGEWLDGEQQRLDESATERSRSRLARVAKSSSDALQRPEMYDSVNLALHRANQKLQTAVPAAQKMAEAAGQQVQAFAGKLQEYQVSLLFGMVASLFAFQWLALQGAANERVFAELQTMMDDDTQRVLHLVQVDTDVPLSDDEMRAVAPPHWRAGGAGGGVAAPAPAPAPVALRQQQQHEGGGVQAKELDATRTERPSRVPGGGGAGQSHGGDARAAQGDAGPGQRDVRAGQRDAGRRRGPIRR